MEVHILEDKLAIQINLYHRAMMFHKLRYSYQQRDLVKVSKKAIPQSLKCIF